MAVLAVTVVDCTVVESPLNVAVMLADPIAVGVHVHEAWPLITLVVPQFWMVVPPCMNRTVPVVLAGAPVTVAVNV